MINITNISDQNLRVESVELDIKIKPGESIVLWNNPSSVNGLSLPKAEEKELVGVEDVPEDTKAMWQPVKAIIERAEEETCLNRIFFLRKCREMRRRIVDQDVNGDYKGGRTGRYNGRFVPKLENLDGVISDQALHEAKNAFRDAHLRMETIYYQEKQDNKTIIWD